MSTIPRIGEAIKHGEHIFVYCNIRTNQIIYSLSRSMNNHHSLKQIPQLGKKSRPSALRKDLWRPFAHLQFPHPQLGLQIYHKLREYRKLHELSYPISSVLAHPKEHGVDSSTPFIPKEEFRSKASHKLLPPSEVETGASAENGVLSSDGIAPSSSVLEESSSTSIATNESTLEPIYTMPAPPLLAKKARQHVLMNQKPNTVADIAAALLIASCPTPPHILARRARMERPLKSPNDKLAKRGPGSKRAPAPGERWEGGVQGVKIGWADVRDADFAEKWPGEVVHEDGLESNRYTINWPKTEGEPEVWWWGKYERRKKVEEPEDDGVGSTEEEVRMAA